MQQQWEHPEAVEWFLALVRYLDCDLVEVAKFVSADKTNVAIVLSLHKTEKQTERNSAVSKPLGQILDKSICWNFWPMGC